MHACTRIELGKKELCNSGISRLKFANVRVRDEPLLHEGSIDRSFDRISAESGVLTERDDGGRGEREAATTSSGGVAAKYSTVQRRAVLAVEHQLQSPQTRTQEWEPVQFAQPPRQRTKRKQLESTVLVTPSDPSHSRALGPERPSRAAHSANLSFASAHFAEENCSLVSARPSFVCLGLGKGLGLELGHRHDRVYPPPERFSRIFSA